MTLGFGGYRISIQSEEHKEALKEAINSGLQVIDTSANYTGGESEELIGEVLNELSNADAKLARPLIISKVGYIQGSNFTEIEALNSKGKALEELVKVSDTIWHSIHPDFIKNQINLSLKRLGIESLDIYLLHNPEYYFYEKDATQGEYYKRITKAFSYLEDLVEQGVIKSYGLSSNNLILSPTDPKCTNIDKVYECALSIGRDHHFKWIQFPFNIIETSALDKHYGGLSLLDKAQAFELKTMINRPLNAFKDGRLIRLASYQDFIKPLSQMDADRLYDRALDLLDKKIKAQDPEESIHDIALIKQIKNIWLTQATPDAVEQVFHGHFFPLIGRVWGGDLSPKEAAPFFEMFECALNFSRQNMTKASDSFKEQATRAELIEKSSEPLQLQLLKIYESYGFDLILVGMKNKSYVEQLKCLF